MEVVTSEGEKDSSEVPTDAELFVERSDVKGPTDQAGRIEEAARIRSVGAWQRGGSEFDGLVFKKGFVSGPGRRRREGKGVEAGRPDKRIGTLESVESEEEENLYSLAKR